MKISIDQEDCCGSGLCSLNAKGVFGQREEDGVVVALTDEPTADQYDAVRAAAATCPTSAIRLID